MIEGAIKKPMPSLIVPMLAYLVKEPFDSDEWVFEIKWDGFRAISEVRNQNIEIYSRNFKSFNLQFPPIVDSLKTLKFDAIFDGEIVVIDKNGKSDFQALQNYQKTGMGDLRYVIFDLLYFNGYDLRNSPLLERKKLLQKQLSKIKKNDTLYYSDHIIGQGKKIFQEIKKLDFEGIMAKKMDSSYVSIRSRNWLKIKTHMTQSAIICGFTEPKGSREKFGSLVLGIYKDNNELKYIGNVGGGFDQKKLLEIEQLLKPYIVKECPFKKKPFTQASVTWVKPKFVCEIRFAEWTVEGIMRQPIFIGLRSDISAKEVKIIN